jgi:hypothetical protein
MKKLVISALAFGAMASAASAEPLYLSSAQMDEVTAGRIRVNANVALIRARQTNVSIVRDSGGVFADDIQGRCDDCQIFVDGSVNVDQSNEIDVDQEIDD